MKDKNKKNILFSLEGISFSYLLGTQKITALCAKNHLLVDFHDGPVHPYGQMRTWPNAVTREFCHAQLDGHNVFSPKTFVTSVFVNMISGPIDMNNGMFDLRQGKTNSNRRRPILFSPPGTRRGPSRETSCCIAAHRRVRSRSTRASFAQPAAAPTHLRA